MSGVRLAISRAPMRISLAGGGTDLPSFASRHGGLVVAVAIDRYVTVTVSPGASVAGGSSLHGRPEPPGLEEVRGRLFDHALRRSSTPSAVQVGVISDVPSGTGLGGSGAFTVALLQALALSSGEPWSPARLAEEATALEAVDLGRPVGCQDHHLAAVGGLVALHVGRDGTVRAEALPVDDALRAYVRDRLLLFYTGRQRDAGAVLGPQAERTTRGDESTVATLTGIRDLASTLREKLLAGRTTAIGEVLDAHWELKSRMGSQVAPPDVEEAVAQARACGADGVKLLGAGGGGFLVVSVAPDRSAELRRGLAARGLTEVPFALAEQGARGLSPALPR